MAYTSASNSTGNLSVLIRNGVHASASIRFALKCDSFTISYGKTPIQIPIPQSNPEIIDLGSFRPSLSMNLTVDTVQPTPASITVGGQTYYIPFKNWFENQIYDLIFTDSEPIEVEVGDTTYPQASDEAYDGGAVKLSNLASWTGGAIYRGAIQQCRFALNPAREDRWDVSLQMVTNARQDWVDKSEFDD
tara:strand:- start:70 stop:639 length:570 start_codon:yes stop_codon:yes gene_type:complete